MFTDKIVWHECYAIKLLDLIIRINKYYAFQKTSETIAGLFKTTN